MPSKIIIAGHICLDIHPHLSGPADARPGQLLKIGPATVTTGGAVANTGLALHRLGVEVGLMGKVGDDAFGRLLLDLLREHSSHLSDGMIVAPGEATSYSIVIAPPGIDRSFMHFPGANDTFTAGDVRYDQLSDAAIVHFGYPPVMQQMYRDEGVQLRQLLGRIRAAGLITSLDMCQPDPTSEAGRVDWPALLARVLPVVDVFQPSIEELLFMLDRPAHTQLAAGKAIGDVVELALLRKLSDTIIDMGSAIVLIKLGDSGLYLRTTSDASRIDPLAGRLGLDRAAWTGREIVSSCFTPSQIAGTTGSGDCTIAGFLAALLRGEDPAAAATHATAVGACSVESADATSGVPHWDKVAARIAAGWERSEMSILLNEKTSEKSLGTITLQ